MAGINALIQRLERMAASDVKHRIMQKVTPAAHDECLRGFREQRNPYGVPWAPRKKPRGWAALAFGHIEDGHPLLDKTGKGVESLTSRAVGDRAVMRFGRGYMRFHQTGTKFMDARKIFPEQAQGLGLWAPAINRAAVDAVRQMCEGK